MTYFFQSKLGTNLEINFAIFEKTGKMIEPHPKPHPNCAHIWVCKIALVISQKFLGSAAAMESILESTQTAVFLKSQFVYIIWN